ncbi:hypothetical protein ACVWWG_004373 [Bradyrhizobium sp. LB7.2]
MLDLHGISHAAVDLSRFHYPLSLAEWEVSFEPARGDI